jgi:excisionase family DNA binding protein
MITYNGTKHYTPPEVSRLLAANLHTVRRWIRAGVLATITIGRKRYVPETELARLFNAGREGSKS